MNMTNKNEYNEPINNKKNGSENQAEKAGDKAESTKSITEKHGNKEENDRPEQKDSLHNEEAVSLPVADYLALKKAEYYKTEGASDEGWNQLRSQINSGLYLQIHQKMINLYARADLTYEQREIMKFYLFENTDAELVSKAAKYPASEMLIFLRSSQSENNLVSTVSEHVSIINDNIKLYREDMKSLSYEMEEKMTEYKEKIAEYEQQLRNKDKIIEEKTAAYNKLLNENRKRIADAEKKKTFDSQVEEAANRLFAEKMLEEELKKSREKEIEDKIRDEYELKYPRKKKKGFSLFPHKDKAKNKHEGKNASYKVEKLPEGFDIAEYIIHSSLSSSQYSIITLAVKMQIDESIIKQMIDNNLPAEQMKQLLSIILVKKEHEKRKGDTQIRKLSEKRKNGDDNYPADDEIYYADENYEDYTDEDEEDYN